MRRISNGAGGRRSGDAEDAAGRRSQSHPRQQRPGPGARLSSKAEALGYRVLDLGSFLEGGNAARRRWRWRHRAQHASRWPAGAGPPVCVLSGGETTVTLGGAHGRGGRNQEFVLAAASSWGARQLREVVVLSGGTDGEDGPTDAAGALADAGPVERAGAARSRPRGYLARHDAYTFFAATGDLLNTGLTGPMSWTSASFWWGPERCSAACGFTLLIYRFRARSLRTG